MEDTEIDMDEKHMYLRCYSVSFQMRTGSVGVTIIHVELIGAGALSMER